ncbi:MarR family transcriptional regulator [Pseudarthrobacter sp. AG30]|uniref:MarR family winged helix-turn-helix transcriptional regulator n=1 Tax=Micrococcaceae TaxID=1268 RepID=UPI000D65B8AB|nr:MULTISPECIES: MarR family transcriptional regulator [Micrococcaceae]RAX18068.1 MarR family transcriptional regulator [Pseudarthrobacter sp. AG30]TDT80226.1 DNA-binding MarR family transcriptional regulator [Arthrobacter sp. AG258]
MDEAPSNLTPTQLGAYFAFTEVSSLLRHAVEKQLRDAGDLSYVQFQLLARLGDAPDGQLRMTDLADGVVYSRSGLTYQAQSLEQRGLVSRSPSPEDERSTVLTLTDAGRTVLGAVFPGHINAVRSLLFAALSDSDVDDLARILGRASAHLRAAPPRSAAPRRRKAT